MSTLPTDPDLSAALEVLSGTPPGWLGNPAAARDGLIWLVALPGSPRREMLANAWPRRDRLQLSAACLEPSWGSGGAKDPLALASVESILLGWWCQAETVLVCHDLLAESLSEADGSARVPPNLLDNELPPAVCFLPAVNRAGRYVTVPYAVEGGAGAGRVYERLLAVLVVRAGPSLAVWDASVAALFDQPPPGWPGSSGPRLWAAALWADDRGRLARSAGPVQTWDGSAWTHGEATRQLRPDGPARSATRVALAVLSTIAESPERVCELRGSGGTEARLAA